MYISRCQGVEHESLAKICAEDAEVEAARARALVASPGTSPLYREDVVPETANREGEHYWGECEGHLPPDQKYDMSDPLP
jgi:hypothetical protein